MGSEANTEKDKLHEDMEKNFYFLLQRVISGAFARKKGLD